MWLIVIEQWSRRYQEAQLRFPYRTNGPMGMWIPRRESLLVRVEKDGGDLIITILGGGYPQPISFPVGKSKQLKTLTIREMVELALGGKFVFTPDPADNMEGHVVEVLTNFDHSIIGEVMRLYGLEDPVDLFQIQPRLVLEENKWGHCDPRVAEIG